MQRAKTIILLTAMATMLCSAAVVAQDQYPPAGYDYVNTRANVSIYDPLDPATLLEVVAMDGRAVIYRGDPYDAGGGVMTIDTRMDTLILRGYSLNFGDSIFAVLDRSGPLSTGQIWQLTAGTDFPAESYFDVYYKLTFTTEPANPSPGDGPDDDVTRHGSFNYDLQSQSGSMVSAKAVPLTSKLPESRPAQETPDKGTRQGGEDIGSATYIPALPYSDGGNTCQYANDYDEVCPFTGSDSPDVVYALDPPADAVITISLCTGASYDTKLYVYKNDVNTLVACNDDACPGYISEIECLSVSAGNTYYIVVDGYGGDCGDYVLTVEDCNAPCVIDCGPGFVQEQEVCGDDTNGGCNMAIPAFEIIACDVDVCGTAWVDDAYRDTDWYSFTIATQMTIEVTGSAEFPYILGFVDTSDCAQAASVDPYVTGNPCDTLSASRVAGPGTYYVFMAPQGGSPLNCGESNNYFFSLRCYSMGGDDLTPVDPPHMIDTIFQIPPHGRVYIDPRKTPVVNAAGDTIAWVWHEHIVDPPEGGIDTIPTIGIMNVWVGPNQPSPTQPPDETVELVGEAIISRSDPYINPQEQREIQTEILSMDLTGESAQLGPMILSLPFPSPGLVNPVDPDPGGQFFPAESFFDVYYQVDLPQEGLTIEPMQPPRMTTTVEALPPVDNQYNDQTGEPHPVHDIQNPGIPIGWILPIHWVQPRDTTPPPPPPDTIPTIGLMPVIVGPSQPSPSQPPDETIYLEGEVIIQRGDEYDDPAGGQHVIETEILSMDLIGNSNLFGEVILSLPLPSPGQITTPLGGPEFPAESFFDVYYEVELPDQGQTIAPAGEPPYMHAEINEIPPVNTQLVADDWHPVHDVQNPGVIIGWVWPIHWVDPPTTGACCDIATGACRITTAADCDPAVEEYQGDGTSCVPNPCEQPCPTGWYPGTSIIQYSAFQVDIFDPNDNSYLGTVYAFGAGMVVQYNTPYEVTPGIWRMDVDILAFAGAGNSPLLGGPFQISLNPQLTSSGYIQMCDSCDDNWAESHFDINYRINTSLPPPDDIYYGNALMDLPCDELWDPYDGAGDFNPPNGHTYVDPRKVPIYNDAGEIIGYTMKKHRVDKDPLGACCEDGTGLCFIMTQAECESSGGMYMGDNVSCDPNPCPQPCTTGWTPGVDTIPTHDFEIELYDNTGTVLITTLTATGIDMIVQRGVPYEVSPGIWRMDTQILQLDGSGNDPVLGGPFDIHLAPAPPSTGYIQMCDSCDDNWAESFFTVHWIITTTLPFPMDVLTGDPADMHLDCSGQWDPFASGAFLPPVNIPYNDPRIVPIYNAAGEIIGYTRKRHMPGGRCCCGEIRGNIDCDPDCQIDISDLVYLVDWMFTGGPPSCCFEEVDVNCDGVLDISDLVYLVDYMFTGGPRPCPCDCILGEDCYPVKNGSSSKMGEETMRKWSSHVAPVTMPTSCPTDAVR